MLSDWEKALLIYVQYDKSAEVRSINLKKADDEGQQRQRNIQLCVERDKYTVSGLTNWQRIP